MFGLVRGVQHSDNIQVIMTRLREHENKGRGQRAVTSLNSRWMRDSDYAYFITHYSTS